MRSSCKPLKPEREKDGMSVLAVVYSGNITQSSKIVNGVGVKSQ